MRVDLTHWNQWFDKLSQKKLKLEAQIINLQWENATLKSYIAILKGDKSLLQKNHDELAASTSTKDKESREANDHVFAAIAEKMHLEEVKETWRKLLEAETIHHSD